MASALPIVLVLFIVIGLMATSWFSIRKGPQQTLIRTSLLLSLTCCYLMWAIAYLAQLHPLEVPKVNLALEH
ncbi:ATPase, V0 complex, subunit E1/e2 [Lactarius akahatsu]|uniref:ATPase, V0 complex, subunit E1/e2 n=1 Tax=Lactarius akahatsu TaxID=416441 RepID=A0AAD4LQ77_9AGAM|nr:ATPase, V0 complex, subunit E1/e2 [Lactarius akahatsu]